MISYSNQAKEVEAAVPATLIAEHGAVSAEVAAAMAEGVSHRFGTEPAWRSPAWRVRRAAARASRSARTGSAWRCAAIRPRAEHRLYAHDRDGNKAAAALDALELALAEVMAATPVID